MCHLEKHFLLANRFLERVNLGPAFTRLLLDASKCIKSHAKVDLAFHFGNSKNLTTTGLRVGYVEVVTTTKVKFAFNPSLLLVFIALSSNEFSQCCQCS